jgi:hypothetical protein
METDPEPDPDMTIHFFSPAIVHELLRELVVTEHDPFIDEFEKGNGTEAQ